VSPIESVFDEFNGGRRSPWAIKRFIRHALNNWSAKVRPAGGRWFPRIP